MSNITAKNVQIAEPTSSDTGDIYGLIGQCPPLDQNSIYCNFIQAEHFSRTSAIAFGPGNEAIGFVSGFAIPERPHHLFVWQVAVSEKARGIGLAKQMVYDIVARPATVPFVFIEATIAEENAASWALFGKISKEYGAPLKTIKRLRGDHVFNGEQPSEMLIGIGPLA